MYGDGSIWYVEKKKRWVYCYFDGNGKKVRRFFVTEREAKAEMKRIRGVRETTNTTLLFGDWLLEYLKLCKPKQQETSWKRTMQTAKYLEPLAAYPLADLSAMTVQQLITDLQATLSPSSVNKVRQMINAAYKRAIALRLVSYNPVGAVEPVRQRKPQIEIFTFGELVRVLGTLKYDEYYAKYYLLYLTLLVTGMRLGEVLALRWSDVDFKNEEITVRRNLKNLKGVVVGAVKTKAGEGRQIPLVFPRYVKLLKAHRTEGTVIALDGYVFHTSSGTPISANNAEKIWSAIRTKSGITKNIHVFRHTFATLALSRGIPVLEVSRIIGHADASTTLNKYGHAIKNYNDRIKEMFRPVKSAQQKRATR